VAAAAAVALVAGHAVPLWLQGLLTLALVTATGPLIYRLAYQPLADASVLLLLIVSVGVHFALVGLGLVFFGAEGYRTPPFWDTSFALGPLTLTGQTIVVLAASAALMAALALFFGRTLAGKALRATAINRLGARLVGVSTEHAGRSAFAMAAFVGALAGLLIGPSTTMIYDSGFLIGLKGFVAAIIGGLSSYPVTVVGALLVGLLDSFSSFWASAYKDAIVFAAIVPVLLLRSLTDRRHDEDE
ncbi:MAG TPA: branched-chain amino acid ABC transporter permease, partial [Burkholderiaceae bacterium]